MKRLLSKFLTILMCLNLLFSSFAPLLFSPSVVQARDEYDDTGNSSSGDVGWSSVPTAETAPAAEPQEQVTQTPFPPEGQLQSSCVWKQCDPDLGVMVCMDSWVDQWGEGFMKRRPTQESCRAQSDGSVTPAAPSTAEPAPTPNCGEPQSLGYNECTEECRVSHPVLQDSCGRYSFGSGQYDPGCTNNCPAEVPISVPEPAPEPAPEPSPLCIPDCSGAWVHCSGEVYSDGCGGSCNGSFAGSCDSPAALSVCTSETYVGTCGRECPGLNDCTPVVPPPAPPEAPPAEPTAETFTRSICTPDCTADWQVCRGETFDNGCGGTCNGAKDCTKLSPADEACYQSSACGSPAFPPFYDAPSQQQVTGSYANSSDAATDTNNDRFAQARSDSNELDPAAVLLTRGDGVVVSTRHTSPAEGVLQGGGVKEVSNAYLENDRLLDECAYEKCDPDVGKKVCVQTWVHEYIYSNYTDQSASYTQPGRVTGDCQSKFDVAETFGGTCKVSRVNECDHQECDTNLGQNVCIEQWETDCGSGKGTTFSSKPGRATGSKCGDALKQVSTCVPELVEQCSYTECNHNLGLEMCMDKWTKGGISGGVCNQALITKPGVQTEKACEYAPVVNHCVAEKCDFNSGKIICIEERQRQDGSLYREEGSLTDKICQNNPAQAIQAIGAQPLTALTYGSGKSATELSSQSLTIQASEPVDPYLRTEYRKSCAQYYQPDSWDVFEGGGGTKYEECVAQDTCERAFPDDPAKVEDCRAAGGVVALVTAGEIAFIAGAGAFSLAGSAIIPVVSSATALPGTISTALGTGSIQFYVYATNTGGLLLSRVPAPLQGVIQRAGAIFAQKGDIIINSATVAACTAVHGFNTPEAAQCFAEAIQTPGAMGPAAKEGAAAVTAVTKGSQEVKEAGGILGGAKRLVSSAFDSVGDGVGRLFGRGANKGAIELDRVIPTGDMVTSLDPLAASLGRFSERGLRQAEELGIVGDIERLIREGKTTDEIVEFLTNSRPDLLKTTKGYEGLKDIISGVRDSLFVDDVQLARLGLDNSIDTLESTKAILARAASAGDKVTRDTAIYQANRAINEGFQYLADNVKGMDGVMKGGGRYDQEIAKWINDKRSEAFGKLTAAREMINEIPPAATDEEFKQAIAAIEVKINEARQLLADANSMIEPRGMLSSGRALSSQEPVVIETPITELSPAPAAPHSGHPNLSKVDDIKFYDNPDYQIILDNGKKFTVSKTAFDLSGRTVISLMDEDGRVFMVYQSMSENNFKHFTGYAKYYDQYGQPHNWVIKSSEEAVPGTPHLYSKVIENAPFDFDAPLKRLLSEGKINVVESSEADTVARLQQMGMYYDGNLEMYKGREIMNNRVREFGVQARQFDNNLLNQLKIDRPSDIVVSGTQINLYYEIKDSAGDSIKTVISVNPVYGERYIGKGGESKPLIVNVTLGDNYNSAFIGSPGVVRTEEGIQVLGSYETVEQMVFNSRIGQELLRIINDRSIPYADKASLLAQAIERQVATVKGVSTQAPETKFIQTSVYEIERKREQISRKLEKDGKIQWSEIEQIVKEEVVKPEVRKSSSGFVLTTGKEGAVEGVVEANRYIVSVDPIPGLDLFIPAIVDTTKGSSAEIHIKVKKGSGKAEKQSAISKRVSLIGTAYAAEEAKNPTVKVIVEAEDGSVLPWAGVKIQLEKVNQEKVINLSAGWNLVSLTVLPGKPLTASVMLDIINAEGGSASAVSTLQDGAWKTFVSRGSKDYSTDDFLIEPGKAYFVKALKPSRFTYSGQNLVAPIKLKLSSGWNAVGMPVLSKQYKAADLDVDTAARWYSGLWDTFVKKNQQQYGENFSILPGAGYILKVGKETQFSP